jgi:hypothetical protein
MPVGHASLLEIASAGYVFVSGSRFNLTDNNHRGGRRVPSASAPGALNWRFAPLRAAAVGIEADAGSQIDLPCTRFRADEAAQLEDHQQPSGEN